MAKNTLSNITLGIAGGLLSFGLGVALATPPGLPKDFRQAAAVGQVTQKQAVQACFNAQTGINTGIMTARGDNKFAPAQFVNYHCPLVVVITDPATSVTKSVPLDGIPTFRPAP